MRFIAKSSRYSTCFKRDIVEHFATGQSRTLQPLWNCQFQPDSWRPHEAQVARESFINRGMPVELDGVTPINPVIRWGSFDTEAFQREHANDNPPFTDALRKELEQFLLSHPDYGSTFLMVEEIRTPAPWPTYDDFRGVKGTPTAQRIAERVAEDGYDVHAVIAYERENANREDVLTELEALLAPAPEDESVVFA